ncbi:MAG TPA: hypothetical protein VF432_33035 [Thermoanaerobaculia bacterium]
MSTIAVLDFPYLTHTRKLEEIGDLALCVAESSDEFRQKVASLAIWWANVHPDPERLLPILYMRVQADLQTSTLSAGDLVERVKRAHATRHLFDPWTVAELVATTEARIWKSRFLAHKHALAQQEIAEMEPAFARIAQKLAPRLDATAAAIVAVVILFV